MDTITSIGRDATNDILGLSVDEIVEEEFLDETVLAQGEDFVTDILEHAGVRGMKWGIRRSQESLDRAAGRATAKADKANAKAEKATDKALGTKTKEQSKTRFANPKSLSDAELRDAVNRLNLEKQYDQLTTPQKAPQSQKQKSFIQEVGKKVVVGSAVTVAAKIVQSHMEGRTSGLKFKPVVLGAPIKPGQAFLPPRPTDVFKP